MPKGYYCKVWSGRQWVVHLLGVTLSREEFVEENWGWEGKNGGKWEEVRKFVYGLIGGLKGDCSRINFPRFTALPKRKKQRSVSAMRKCEVEGEGGRS